MEKLTLEKKNHFSNPAVLIAVALFCCALWGSATPAIKTGYKLLEIETGSLENVPTIMLFAGIRFLLAGILTVIIFSIAAKKPLYPKKENVPKILTVSVFQTIIQYIFFYLGLAFTSGVKGTIASGSGAFFAVLVASLIFKQEKLTLKKIVACTVGFVGIVIINFNGLEFTKDIRDFLGVIFVLLSTVSNAFSSVLIKKYSKDENPVVISGYQFIVGSTIMIIIGLAFGGTITVNELADVLIFLYLALLSALAYSLWGLLLKHNSVSSVTVFNFTTPIFGTLLTLILIPEENSALAPLNVIITLICVTVGIFMLNYTPKKKTESE